MSWRTIIIANSAKLDYKMDCMVVRQEQITKIYLSEIYMLVIESTAVSITASLMAELMKRKIKVIFCDEKRNPAGELINYYGSHDTSNKYRQQIGWSNDIKSIVWTEIVAEKIRQQILFLTTLRKMNESMLLKQYLTEHVIGDVTNREGHSAKVYFNALFGMDFSRSAEIPVNAALNYGYSILLSAFNREIVANGYFTQLGICHNNMFNQFNLSSDLMEPFRILVDRYVYFMKPDKFTSEEKQKLINLLNDEVIIDTKRNYVNNAIKIYCKSVFNAINENDTALLKFYKYEL